MLQMILISLLGTSLLFASETSSKTYGLNDLTSKAVDNKGKVLVEGAPYGVRNLRVVLDGFVYRGGANNVYPAAVGDKWRENHNPLKNQALENLCNDGFDTAIYLYAEKFQSAAKETQCKDGKKLTYMSLPPLDNPANTKKILEIIHGHIARGPQEKSKKIYLHCWNGWHASGFISAVALRQFCEMPADAAVKYWDTNTDGNNKAARYEKVRQAIRDFKPDEKLKLTADQKKQFCIPGSMS